VHTCIPAETLREATVPALACFVGGVVLTFWGARAIRALIVMACLGAGAYGGWLAAQHFGKPPAVGIVVGAAALGMVGLVMARLWIAGLSGVLAGLVAFSVYGYHEKLPERLETFARSYRQPKPTADNEFPLAEAGTAEAISSQKTFDVLVKFSENLQKTDDPLIRNAALSFGAAFVVGAIIGLIAYRWAMIFWTSLAGLCLMIGGGSVVLTNQWPMWHDDIMRNASATGVVVLVVWLAGIVIQWRGTRRAMVSVQRPAEGVACISKAG
ncbi:MAG: hypothetical protein JXQ73_12465, partial [Phycisphaerae bacterium]|nr:hypothetical protein [Phycisphaerae bacterium]